MGRPGLAALAVLSVCACAHLPPLIEPSDPLSAAEHLRLGAAYEAQGQAGDAAVQYEAAARMKPDDPEAWVALGDLAYSRADYARAESSFKRALKAAPDHPGALNNLAMTYLAENVRLDEAERLAASALERSGTLRPYVLDTLAKIREREDRPGGAAAF